MTEDEELSSLWRLDAIGIKERPDVSGLNMAAVEQFEGQVRKDGARYEVPLMNQEPGLDGRADNYKLAEQRLCLQLRRFRGQPELLSQYDSAIRTYFNDGHAERAPEHDENQGSTTIYYMPHHGVIRCDAVTTRLRVVFDASLHVVGQPSLNSVLCKGPKLDADLLRLLKFRCYPMVMVADIKKAYLQMVVREQDWDALCFLWVKRLPTAKEPFPPIVKWRMTRVAFGARSSPFLLAATLCHHLIESQSTFPDTAVTLQESFYVDDLIIRTNDVNRAHQMYLEARTLMADISSLRNVFSEDKLALED